jgi:hypothetical protein
MPTKRGARRDGIVRSYLAVDVNRPEPVLQRFDDTGRDRLWQALDALPPHYRRSARRALILLSCMMDAVDIPQVPASALGDGVFTTLQRLWYGALYSPKFADFKASYRYELARAFKNLLKTAELPVVPITWGQFERPPQDWIHDFERRPVNSKRTAELRGFYVQDKHGEELRISLDHIARRLGTAFRDRLYTVLSQLSRSRARDLGLQLFAHTFNSFVGQYQGVLEIRQFDSVFFMERFLTEMMFYHFEVHPRNPWINKQQPESNNTTRQTQWTQMRTVMIRLGKAKFWTVPKSIPKGKPSLSRPRTIRHLRNTTTAAGMYTQKLITPVPLSVTDAEAYTLLFHQIEDDATRVNTVLQKEVDRIWADYQTGNALEKAADPEVETQPTPALFRVKTPNALANFIHALRVHCQGYVDTRDEEYRVNPPLWKSWFGLPSKPKVARLMGLLGAQDALIFAARLMSLAPACTEAALLTAEVFSRSGARIGVSETDAGCYLSIRKARGNHPQNVLMKGEAERIIRMLLELTDPVRQYMRRKGIKGWQNLFLYSMTPLGTPVTFTRQANGRHEFRRRIQRFRAELGPLVDTLTLSQIRSTAGVLALLQSESLDEMARTLDHKRSVSIEHYLPEPIWRFFQDRWIRIFQNLLLQAAVKGTPHALAVSDFKTWEELDTFLANNVLQDLPQETETAAKPIPVMASSNALTRILIIAAEKPWAALLSLRDAVRKSATPDRVRPRAWYWAKVADALQAHIQSAAYTDKPIKAILATALAQVQPGALQAVIHA